MSERCEHLTWDHHIVGLDRYVAHVGEEITQQCLRQKGHKGPHLIRQLLRIGGRYVLWKEVLCPYGECEGCDSEDPYDNCCEVSVIADDEAAQEVSCLVNDSLYDPWKEE